jgi:hypothetical protein
MDREREPARPARQGLAYALPGLVLVTGLLDLGLRVVTDPDVPRLGGPPALSA